MTDKLFPEIALQDSDEISIRALNVCRSASIYTSNDLVQYYNTFGSFLKLRNCGNNTEIELVNLAITFLSNENFINKDANSINETLSKEAKITTDEGEIISLIPKRTSELGLTHPTQFICKKNQIYDLLDLMNVYYESKPFSKRLDCAWIIDIELTDFCNEYERFRQSNDFKNGTFLLIKNRLEMYFHLTFEKDISEKISFENLSLLKENILINYIKQKTEALTPRSKNAISLRIDFKNIKDFFGKVILKDFDFKILRNVGVNTQIELTNYHNQCREYFYKIYKNNDLLELLVEYLIGLLNLNFTINERVLDEIRENIFITETIPLFNILHILLKEHIVLDELQYDIFKYCCGYMFNIKPRTLEEISKKYNLTRERIRQIKVKIPEVLGEKLLFLFDLNIDFENNYFVDFDKYFIYFNDEFVDRTNRREDVSFTSHFYIFITWLLKKDKYSIIGYEERFRSQNHWVGVKEYKSSYLIAKSILEVFQMQNFLDNVYERQNEKIVEEYKLPFTGYLSNFLTENCFNNLEIVESICEEILNKELDILVNTDSYIVFDRNSKKQVYEYIIDILEKTGRMMHINEIFEEISKLNIEATNSVESLRSNMQKREIFIVIGRTSVYGFFSTP